MTEALAGLLERLRHRVGGSGSSPHWREFWALRDVSFEVREGEVLGIIGPNGAGKSTILKILSRVTEPTEGFVEIRGRVSALLEVGTGFHPELSGRDNVYLNGAILGMRRAEITKKFDEIVEFSGVEEFIDVPVKRYSSGMFVRLAFAVAANLEPEVLLLDEVLAVGDREFQERSLGRISEIARSGRTVVFVSHDMGAMASLCDRGLLMERGRVEFDGPVADAIERYLGSRPKLHSAGLLDGVERHGSGAVRFRRVSVTDANGRPHVYPNRPVLMELEFSAARPVAGRHLNVGLHVSTALGEPLISLSSEFDGTGSLRTTAFGDGTRLWCQVPELPLRPGKYLLTLTLDQLGELLDEVRDQIEFDVLPADFFGTGVLPSEKQGPVMVRHEWSAAGPAELAAER